MTLGSLFLALAATSAVLPAKPAADRSDAGDPARAASSVLDIADLDVVPGVRKQVPPRYPKDLRKAGVTGEVLIEFVVRADGKVRNVEAVRSTHDGFVGPAVEAVRQWTFSPGQKSGVAVATRLQVPIVFALPQGGR